ncbi:MAG: 2Fe-2S iron-sulfur cluster-binding protein [Bacteroidota bacterium]|nr:2Fe-2S iron-sulfur cluster-binding protein [Bacteroidota bacterium]MDP4236434.1 2Fe-2S iron-sulfur cluster-binding protein [Bacteroidota bacterium]
MPTITYLPMNVTCEALIGDNILEVALANGIDLQHNCGGVCACSTCHVIVRQGLNSLTEMEDGEADQLDEAEGLTLDSRLGCQAKITDEIDLVVEIPQLNPAIAKLFHEGAH